MKDKLNGEIIEEFVGLRAKMYSLNTKKEEMKKAKREEKKVIKKDISHQDYVDFLFEERKFMQTIQSIGSFKHQLYTIKQNKVSFSPYDTCWMMGLALCQTVILVCCKYLRNLSIIFSKTFVIYFNFFRNLR